MAAVSFVFEGLGLLMEHMLISHARDIRFANSFGVDKIQRNILAMQQNLKTIMDGPLEAELERAKKYYSLYALAPAVRLLFLQHCRYMLITLLCRRGCWRELSSTLTSRSTSTRRS